MQLPNPLIKTSIYSVHWYGDLPLSKIIWRYDYNSKIVLSDTEREYLNNAWQRIIGQNKRIEDLPLFRLIYAYGDTEQLELSFGCVFR